MKKIMKYSNIGAILFAIVLSLCGCNDFLEYEPYGPVSSENFWKTESDVRSALDAFYDYTYREEATGRGHFWYENCSDNMFTGRTNTTADQYKNFTMGANTGYADETWVCLYQLIAKANDVLRYVPDMTTVSQSLKDNATGQAYFFRGYGYLWLSPWYGDNGPNGGIPIVTEKNTVDNIDVPRPTSVLENYAMIIADLRKAADLLPYFSELAKEDYGRPYKTAAWAFAARAALYAAKYDPSYFDVVIEMCDKIIQLSGADKRELYPDFTTLFTIENNFSSEYIYSILGNKNDGPKFHGMGFQNGGFGIYNTWGYFQPTAELYEAFDPGDVRRDATILVPGQHITFIGNDIHWAVNPAAVSSPSGMTFRKFMSVFEPADCLGKTVNTSGDNQSNELGTVVMRYADILLMKAEALIWKNGEGNADAKTLLNQIRKRANLPENSNATKTELKKERRLELAFEFLPSRHFDLVRWGDAQAAYAQPLHGYEVKFKTVGDDTYVFDPSSKIEVWPARTFDPAKNHVFPIHATAINSSKNLKQNEGY
jgi:hypothetical protein